MTPDQCHERAAQCAANASLAVSEPVCREFLRLAAQWRAMAARLIHLGPIDGAPDTLPALNALSLPPA
jgi:hypothetical protein